MAISSFRSDSQSNGETGIVPASRIIGAGEMADLIRAFDWEDTPLGPADTWSDTLITTVNLVLASRHPMFLWWGPNLIQFYNDGYRPSLGSDKHPSAIGQRGIDCWPEIWSIIGPQIEAVMTQGASTWNENHLVPINRNGKLEEVFWTYGYSPVRDKDGSVKGTLVVCSETTEQVLSERRLRTLLAIAAEPQRSSSDSLLSFSQNIVSKLDDNPADIPFAALYIVNRGEVLSVRTAGLSDALADPGVWPIDKVIESQVPSLIEDLQQRLGDLILSPWPEPLTSAYLVPLRMPGVSIQAILLLGISPRLPFDQGYRTFFEVIAARIAGLMESAVRQQELAQAVKRFQRLSDTNPFGMVIGDLHGNLSYVSPALLATLEYSEAEVNSGKVQWSDLTPPEYAEADARAVKQLRERGSCDIYEKVYVAKSGRRIPLLVGAAVIDSAVGEVAGFLTDLTPLKAAQEALRKANDQLEKKIAERTSELLTEVSDRQRAETALRELTGRLLRTQDEERRHMARELHDHAGQTLTALGLNLAALQAAAKGTSAKIEQLAKDSQQLSDALSKEIRTLSYLLHPPLLDEVGLQSALQWYVDGFSERSKINVELFLPSDFGRLSSELELVIFRVIQESLTNIHRHSGSSSATIYLNRSESAVMFEVRDKGKGISPERQREMAAKSGVGVRGMEERVRQFGGTLKIESNNKGTKVVVTLPLTIPN